MFYDSCFLTLTSCLAWLLHLMKVSLFKHVFICFYAFLLYLIHVCTNAYSCLHFPKCRIRLSGSPISWLEFVEEISSFGESSCFEDRAFIIFSLSFFFSFGIWCTGFSQIQSYILDGFETMFRFSFFSIKLWYVETVFQISLFYYPVWWKLGGLYRAFRGLICHVTPWGYLGSW